MDQQAAKPGLKGVEVVVADDRLQAWLTLPDRMHPEFIPPKAADVAGAIKRAGLETNAALKTRLEQYLKLLTDVDPLAETPEWPERYLIAEGRPAVDAVDAVFTWYDAFGEDQHRSEEEQVNYYTLNSIITVNPDTPIGTLTPEQNAVTGVDVYGRPVQPAHPRPLIIKIGSGLRLDEAKGNEVVTEVVGRVVQRDSELRVEEVLDIPGDVDFETGIVDSAVAVTVHGAIRVNFTVKTKKSLVVHGTIEGAHVSAEEDITCMKGLVGSIEHGEIAAKGVITARFANDALVRSDGGVRIARSVMGSDIWTGGDLLIENGAVIGGKTYARQGVVARTLGSDAGVKTHITVGVDPYVLARVKAREAEVKHRQKMVDQIREKVQPLMSQLKRLSAEQRERATELLSKADEQELAIDDLETQNKAELGAASPDEAPTVLVNREVFPGVCISFGKREVVFNDFMHGPIQIEERKVNNVTEVVAVNKSTGSVTVLPSRHVDLDAFAPPPPAEKEETDAE